MALWCHFFVAAAGEQEVRAVVARVEKAVHAAAPGCLLEVEWSKPYWKIEGQWDVMARIHPPNGTGESAIGRLLIGALGRGWDPEWQEADGDSICATNVGGEIAVEGVTWINLFLAKEPDQQA